MTCPIPAPLALASPAVGLQDLAMSPAQAERTHQGPPTAANPLERLAQLVNSNDRLMDELTTSRARIVSARNYLDRPGCNARFGKAHLERCRDRHSGILAQLRANRIEALRLLAEGNSDV
jgi:hypothetical protein